MRWNFGKRGVSTTFGSKNFRVTLPVARYSSGSRQPNGGSSTGCLGGCFAIVIGGTVFCIAAVLLAGLLLPKQPLPVVAQPAKPLDQPTQKTNEKPVPRVVLEDPPPRTDQEIGPDGLTKQASQDRAWNEWRMCEKLMRDGKISTATKQRLERLVDRYPGTPGAEKAQAVLNSL